MFPIHARPSLDFRAALSRLCSLPRRWARTSLVFVPQEEHPLTEADSQQREQEDRTSERLALAKVSFAHVEDHVAAVETKARTFLTVNSLLVGAGVLSVARGVSAESGHAVARAVLLLSMLCLLAFVAAAFHSLFEVLDVRRFEGHPQGARILDDFKQDDAATLRESLARYYADAAEKNRPVAEGKVKHLKRAVGYTRRAFWSFVATIVMLTLVVHIL